MTSVQRPGGGTSNSACWWCQKRPADDHHHFKMFSNASRTTRRAGITKRVETTTWDSTSLPVPVCQVCKSAHQAATKAWNRWALFVIGGIFAWLAALIIAGVLHLPAWLPWIVLLLFIVVGVAVGRAGANAAIRAADTRRYGAGASFPTVEQLKAQGWKPGKPGSFFKNRGQLEYF